MLNGKKLLTKIVNAVPRYVVKNSWGCIILNGTIVCGQLFTLTPDAANTTTVKEITLPYTMANTAYYVLVTTASQPQVATCIVAGHRKSTTKAEMSIYASNTTTRDVFCVVIGKLA